MRPVRATLRPFLACTLLCAAPALRAVDVLLVNMTRTELRVGAQTGQGSLLFRLQSGDEGGEFQNAPTRGFAVGEGAILQIRVPDEEVPATGLLSRLDVASAADPGKPGHLLLRVRPAVPGQRRVELTSVMGGRRWVSFERDATGDGDPMFFLDALTALRESKAAVAPDPGGERLSVRTLRVKAARNAVASPCGAAAPAPAAAGAAEPAPGAGAGCACSIL
jgi:hypothetical protein